VSHDGVGLFERIAGSFAIDDPQLAMLELGKGKLTSQPQRHSGHGLFFSSRLGGVFDIHANGSRFQRHATERLAQFNRAELDFSATEPVSHGFADELLRVFQQEHPEVALVPVGTNAQVRAMFASVAA
jgi:hypothetical protein